MGTATNWQAVAAGIEHTVALRRDGTLWAWGYNHYGQLGDGTTTNQSQPGSGGQLTTNWQTVAAGGYHTVALKRDGTLWAWGYNDYGQLGDGTTADKPSPIAGGHSHQLAVGGRREATTRWRFKSDGTLWAWGYNHYGQLGDGTTTNKSSPVADGQRPPTGSPWRRELTTRWRLRATARSGLGATMSTASWAMAPRPTNPARLQVGTADQLASGGGGSMPHGGA